MLPPPGPVSLPPLADEPLLLQEVLVKKQIASAILGTGGSNAARIRKVGRLGRGEGGESKKGEGDHNMARGC